MIWKQPGREDGQDELGSGLLRDPDDSKTNFEKETKRIYPNIIVIENGLA